jgi:hypothetical protein
MHQMFGQCQRVCEVLGIVIGGRLQSGVRLLEGYTRRRSAMLAADE